MGLTYLTVVRNMDFHHEGNATHCEDILTELEKEISMVYLLKQLGYKHSLNVSLCKEMLSLLMPLTEMTVARILGTIICSDEGLQDHGYSSSTFFSARGSQSQSDAPSLNSWNADVLIESIEELAPGINWTIVMENLDHEGLYIHHEAAFCLIMSCYIHSRQYGATLRFPVVTLGEDENLETFGSSIQLSAAQGLLQAHEPNDQLPVQDSSIKHQVIVDPSLQAVGLYNFFKRVLPIVMHKATQEVSGLVQRCVSTAIQTTKELMFKDYARESNERCGRHQFFAAQLLVARLAGSLAWVTCKAPLRSSISSLLWGYFPDFSIAREFLQPAVQLVTKDNVDLGCVLIERAAAQKAVRMAFTEVASLRSVRNHREASDAPSVSSFGGAQSKECGSSPKLLSAASRSELMFGGIGAPNFENQFGVYAESSSGLGCYGISTISHPQDLENMDPSSPKLLSASEIYQAMSG